MTCSDSLWQPRGQLQRRAPLQRATAKLEAVLGSFQLEVAMPETLLWSLERGLRTDSHQRARAFTPKHSLSDGANSKQSLHQPRQRPGSSVLTLRAAKLHRTASKRQSMNHAVWNCSAWGRSPPIWNSRSKAGIKACSVNCIRSNGLKSSSNSRDPLPAHLTLRLFGHGPPSYHGVSVTLQT